MCVTCSGTFGQLFFHKKKNGPIRLLDDSPHQTLIPQKHVDCFTPVATVMPVNSSVQLKQETHYERPARHGPNGFNGKQLRVTHYERPARHGS